MIYMTYRYLMDNTDMPKDIINIICSYNLYNDLETFKWNNFDTKFFFIFVDSIYTCNLCRSKARFELCEYHIEMSDEYYSKDYGCILKILKHYPASLEKEIRVLNHYPRP